MTISFVSLSSCEQNPFAKAKHDTLARVSLSEHVVRPIWHPKRTCSWSRNLRISCFVSRHLICDAWRRRFQKHGDRLYSIALPVRRISRVVYLRPKTTWILFSGFIHTFQTHSWTKISSFFQFRDMVIWCIGVARSSTAFSQKWWDWIDVPIV